MKSIRRTLGLRLSLGALALLLVAAACFYTVAGWLFTDQFDGVMRTKLAAFSTLIEQEDDYIELDFIELGMPEFRESAETPAASGPEYVQLWLADRTDDWVLYRSPSLEDQDLPRIPGTEESPGFADIELPDGRPGRAIGAEFEVHHHDPGPSGRGPVRLALVIAKGSEPLDRALATLVWGTGALIVSVLGLGLALGGRAVAAGLRPLDRLARVVRGIEEPQHAPRFDPATLPAELVPLAESHNRMLDRIEAAFERERRTAANIAHELRTPVSELVVLAETIRHYPAGSRESERRLEELRGIGFQMSSLIATLLELARMEAGHVPLEIEPIDLAEIVRECWKPLRGIADGKQQVLEGVPEEGPEVRTDRVAFSILLANLLRNAVEHAPRGDVVRCTIQEAGDGCRLVLSNSIDGIVPAGLERRGDEPERSEAENDGREHAGIGLGLVHRFAELLELELTVRLDNGGFEARLGFGPRPADEPAEAVREFEPRPRGRLSPRPRRPTLDPAPTTPR